MNKEPLIIEQEFNAPVELVWRAITERELMKKWYFDISNFKPEVGCKFQFEGGREGRCYTHLCEVLEVVPNQKLRYSWKYEGYEGMSYVTFELFPIGEKTKLKLTHEGLETFPIGNSDFVRDNFVGGWKFLVKESLLEYLENGKSLIGHYEG